MVVAVFMLGMGLGSLAGGYLADRLVRRHLLLVFAAAEGFIALFALASRALYAVFFYGLAADVGGRPVLVGAVAASTLILPTACMGETLPVLSKAIQMAWKEPPGALPGLNGWNMLGAAAGAWLGSAWLIRSVGYERSLWIGAGLNLLCAAAVLAMRDSGPVAPAHSPAPASSTIGAADRGWWQWPMLYFLSGFVALGLEMVWFRLLGVALKSTAFTFPLLLGFYLLGVGGGSLAGRALADGRHDAVRWFLAAQAAVPLYAGLSVAAFIWALRTQSSLAAAR